MDSTEVAHFEFPALPGLVGVARSVAVAAAGAVPGLDEERIDDLRIAVSEACTNAMEAHAGDDGSSPIVLRCVVHPNRFEVHIDDRGAGFDPDALASRPVIDEGGQLQDERGWGIQLMRALVDEVEFAALGAGTTVRLVLKRANGS